MFYGEDYISHLKGVTITAFLSLMLILPIHFNSQFTGKISLEYTVIGCITLLCITITGSYSSCALA